MLRHGVPSSCCLQWVASPIYLSIANLHPPGQESWLTNFRNMLYRCVSLPAGWLLFGHSQLDLTHFQAEASHYPVALLSQPPTSFCLWKTCLSAEDFTRDVPRKNKGEQVRLRQTQTGANKEAGTRPQWRLQILTGHPIFAAETSKVHSSVPFLFCSSAADALEGPIEGLYWRGHEPFRHHIRGTGTSWGEDFRRLCGASWRQKSTRGRVKRLGNPRLHGRSLTTQKGGPARGD